MWWDMQKGPLAVGVCFVGALLRAGEGPRPFHLDVPPLPARVFVSLILTPSFPWIVFDEFLGALMCVPVPWSLVGVTEVCIVVGIEVLIFIR